MPRYTKIATYFKTGIVVIMNTYHGSCHCQAVKYEVTAKFTEGMTCNCSHCKRKGLLLAFVPQTQFTLQSGEENLTTYHFNKKRIDHLFCKTCGVQSFAKSGDMVAINLNCLEDLNTEKLEVKKVDGKATKKSPSDQRSKGLLK